MDCALAELTPTEGLIYLDDIIIFSSTFDDHLQRLQHIFVCLQEASLQLKPSKCHFCLPEIRYLGHVVSGEGIKPDPRKVLCVKEYQIPGNVRDLHTFLGLTNYYRKFVEGYAKLADALCRLLKKTTNGFLWTASRERAFETLKPARLGLSQIRLPVYPDN